MAVASESASPFYTGIFLKNSSTSGQIEAAAEDEGTITPYSLNIIHNTFTNGSASMILANYISDYLPYYIRGNTITSVSNIGILGMKICGTTRDNTINNLNIPLGIHLVNSSPNLYNNVIGAGDLSLHMIGYCSPNLGPSISGSQLVWTGGKNRLSSNRYDNIQLVTTSNINTDWGQNRFDLIDSAQSSYHIYGWIDTNVNTYNSRNNCWYPGGIAKIYLRKNYSTSPIPTVTDNTTINCSTEIDPNGWEVDSLGNGIHDSIMLSANNTVVLLQ